MVIDFHTHCFPDEVAKNAVAFLERKSGLKMISDGTLKGLKQRMNEYGVDRSVVLPVATKPSQVPSINKWAKLKRDNELYFFGAVHPAEKDFYATLTWLKENGFRGVKLHTDYINCYADDKCMMPLYEAIRDTGLMLMMHAGADNVYLYPIHCTPLMLKKILDNVRGLKLIAAHMGGHTLWRDAEELLLGKDIYIDTCYSQYALGKQDMERLIHKHGADKVLFGTDSPWKSADIEIARIRELSLPADDIDKILYKNALTLLGD